VVVKGGNGEKTEIRASRHRVNLHKVNDKLDNLKTSNPFFPPDANAPRALEIIPIHNNMYHEVERNGNPGNGRKPN